MQGDRRDPRNARKLVKEYVGCDWSDTFLSYNDAIVIARYAQRLERKVKRLKSALAKQVIVGRADPDE